MKWKRLVSIFAVAVLVAFAVGCSLSGGGDREKPNPSKTPMTENNQKDNSQTPPVNPQPTKEKVEITLYFGDDQAMYLKPEKRSVEKGGKPMAQLFVEELIKGPQVKGLNRTIPAETKLLSLEIVDGVAFVNFSKEMKTKHWGGSAGEAMTSQSVVQTLTQLPDIKKVQFLIEGEKEEAIWGHGYTGEPISPAENIIAK